jgi:hypothetical protein
MRNVRFGFKYRFDLHTGQISFDVERPGDGAELVGRRAAIVARCARRIQRRAAKATQVNVASLYIWGPCSVDFGQTDIYF